MKPITLIIIGAIIGIFLWVGGPVVITAITFILTGLWAVVTTLFTGVFTLILPIAFLVLGYKVWRYFDIKRNDG